jgi:hypothetical protein
METRSEDKISGRRQIDNVKDIFTRPGNGIRRYFRGDSRYILIITALCERID